MGLGYWVGDNVPDLLERSTSNTIEVHERLGKTLLRQLLLRVEPLAPVVEKYDLSILGHQNGPLGI